MTTFDVEYTDTFGGEANYCWVRRAKVSVPELTHYGYMGCGDGIYAKAKRAQQRQLMRKAKATVGITGVRGRTTDLGDMIEFRPYGSATVMFITYSEG